MIDQIDPLLLRICLLTQPPGYRNSHMSCLGIRFLRKKILEDGDRQFALIISLVKQEALMRPKNCLLRNCHLLLLRLIAGQEFFIERLQVLVQLFDDSFSRARRGVERARDIEHILVQGHPWIAQVPLSEHRCHLVRVESLQSWQKVFILLTEDQKG